MLLEKVKQIYFQKSREKPLKTWAIRYNYQRSNHSILLFSNNKVSRMQASQHPQDVSLWMQTD